MRNDKHTPGPWRYMETNGMRDKPAVQRGSEGGFLVYGSSAEREEADARLISAAPDMYEALKDMIAAQMYVDDSDPVIEATKRARAAIAKAEGQQ